MQPNTELSRAELLMLRRERSIVRQLKQLMRNVHIYVKAELNAMGQEIIDARFSDVLAYTDYDGTKIITLADRAGVTKQAMSKLVKEAEKAGYVTTQKDPNDQRAVIVKITQKSLDMGTKVYDISDKMMEQLKAEIGEERMKAFFETMRDINRHYEGNLKSASDKEW